MMIQNGFGYLVVFSSGETIHKKCIEYIPGSEHSMYIFPSVMKEIKTIPIGFARSEFKILTSRYN